MNELRTKLKDKTSFVIGLAVVLLICLGIFFYYGEKKEIMFCDEVYTYTVANVHGVHLAVRDNKWYAAEEMDKRFSSLEGYNFKDVRLGTGNDVSPPIYYNSFKAVAATFPSSTSKWLGFGTNLISFIPFLMLLYWGIWKITEKPWIAAAFTLLLGVNQGMQGIALLIRMYMLFAACMLIFYLYTETLNREKEKIPTYIGLGIVTFMGFMTHYYFAMYVALFSVFFLVEKVLKRKWKQSLAYLGTMIAAVAAATIYFPQWIRHFFGSDKGNTSISTLTDWSDFGAEITEALGQIGNFVFPNYGILYWGVLIIVGIFFFRIKNSEVSNIKKNCGMHLAAQMTYYCVVAHMMPSPEERYYWPVIVLQCITAIYMLAYVLKYEGLLEKKKIVAIILGITAVYVALFPIRMKKVPYHGAEFKEGRLIMEAYSQTPWIIYGDKDWVLHCPAFDFLIPEQIMFHTDTSTIVYDEMLANGKEFVLYVRSDEHLAQVLGKLTEIYEQEWNAEKLADRSYNDAYLITLE